MKEREKLLNKILGKIDGYREEMIGLQRALTAIPAIGPLNGGQGELAKALYLKDYLRQIGFIQIEEYPAPDPTVPAGLRPNLLCRLEGKRRDITVWIMSHLDIVPPGELSLWKSDPFVLKVEDGKLIGRGVEDNQQGMVSSIFAARAFLEAGITPECNLCLLFVSDEETGSAFGLDYLLQHKNLFKKTDLIIVPDAGQSDGGMIEVAEKSILWVQVTTTGKQCHASKPAKGINAFRAASFYIKELDSIHHLFSRENALFDPPVSTFEPTKKEANVPNVNTIPGQDVFYVDCRVLPDYPLPEVLSQMKEKARLIEEAFKVTIDIEPIQMSPAAPATSPDAPVVFSLKQAIKDIYGIDAQPQGIGGGTVAAYFRRSGYPAAVWSRVDESAHQPNEYSYIDNIIGDSKVFAHILNQELVVK